MLESGALCNAGSSCRQSDLGVVTKGKNRSVQETHQEWWWSQEFWCMLLLMVWWPYDAMRMKRLTVQMLLMENGWGAIPQLTTALCALFYLHKSTTSSPQVKEDYSFDLHEGGSWSLNQS
jgi:hypothetical protein